MAKATTKRKPRKPAQVEKIYTSITGAPITDAQKIGEVLVLYRASFLGIDGGREPWKHPSLKPFYEMQFGDISNAIRRYGGRNVVTAVEKSKWIANPQYGDHPLRLRKFVQEISTMTIIRYDNPHISNELPHNHVKGKPRKVRDF